MRGRGKSPLGGHKRNSNLRKTGAIDNANEQKIESKNPLTSSKKRKAHKLTDLNIVAKAPGSNRNKKLTGADLAIMLSLGSAQWNNWRKAQPANFAFESEDFSGRNFAGFDFSGICFKDCNFNDSEIHSITLAVFDGCNFDNTKFTDIVIPQGERLIFDECAFTNAHMARCTLAATDFNNCKFFDCDFRHISLIDGRIAKSKFDNFVFEGLGFSDGDFSGNSFNEGRFIGKFDMRDVNSNSNYFDYIDFTQIEYGFPQEISPFRQGTTSFNSEYSSFEECRFRIDMHPNPKNNSITERAFMAKNKAAKWFDDQGNQVNVDEYFNKGLLGWRKLFKN